MLVMEPESNTTDTRSLLWLLRDWWVRLKARLLGQPQANTHIDTESDGQEGVRSLLL